jgi:hypothetical protein
MTVNNYSETAKNQAIVVNRPFMFQSTMYPPNTFLLLHSCAILQAIASSFPYSAHIYIHTALFTTFQQTVHRYETTEANIHFHMITR